MQSGDCFANLGPPSGLAGAGGLGARVGWLVHNPYDILMAFYKNNNNHVLTAGPSNPYRVHGTHLLRASIIHSINLIMRFLFV